MIPLTIEQICQATQGKLIAADADARTQKVLSISTDSRQIKTGECFVALPGDHFDGHDFIVDAVKQGAGALLISRLPPQARELKLPPVIEVAATVTALENLARFYRQLVNPVFVGITGSVGKTTTKELAYQLISGPKKTIKSEKSFNNQLGVPFTMFRLTQEDEVAIFELGTNGFGEIEHLSGIVQPDIGIITCVAKTHLEGLGSIEGVERAKGELLCGLKKSGVFITNGDDPACRRIAKNFAGKTVMFGCGKEVQFQAHDVQSDGETLRFMCQKQRFHVPIPGKHNVYNVLAAVALARELGIGWTIILSKTAKLKLPPLRMQVQHFPTFTVISDCYNASPQAVTAALQMLADFPGKRKIAVLGSMLELGEQTAAIHYEIGQQAARHQLDRLLTAGVETAALVEGCIAGGMDKSKIVHCEKTEEVFGLLSPLLQTGDVVLLKASRRLQFEKILEKLEESFRKQH